MRCIFCKQNSSSCRSTEHIVPEALGNIGWTLPPGIVCDACNNYFALKVEKPLLDSGRFKNLRARQDIPNKKGFSPPIEGVLQGTNINLSMQLGKESVRVHGLWPTHERDSPRFVDHIRQSNSGTLIFPLSLPVNGQLLSRLLAKIALEAFVERIYRVAGWEESAIDDPQLDPIRRFARRGDQPSRWPYHERRIYAEDSKFIGEDGKEYQTVHEADFLYTTENELYSVNCIFGIEYAINLGGPEIAGYEKWLKANNYTSPLYVKPHSESGHPTEIEPKS